MLRHYPTRQLLRSEASAITSCFQMHSVYRMKYESFEYIYLLAFLSPISNINTMNMYSK